MIIETLPLHWVDGVGGGYITSGDRTMTKPSGQRPHASRRGLARAPMLTSPLALRQEPFGRSVDVHTLGWRLSPRRWKSGVQQADGG
jgi:hypothetical protein